MAAVVAAVVAAAVAAAVAVLLVDGTAVAVTLGPVGTNSEEEGDGECDDADMRCWDSRFCIKGWRGPGRKPFPAGIAVAPIEGVVPEVAEGMPGPVTVVVLTGDPVGAVPKS